VANRLRTYTVAEVADIVGISRSTAYECVRRGEIPSRRFGRRIVVFHHELERMLGASGALTVQMDIEVGTTNNTA
jgi:excisionase family DNA binding protein